MNGRSFWALPGPESFCDRILGNLVEGKSVVLFLPERMPDGLKRTVMSDVAREAPDKCFYELFPSDFDPEDSPLASLFRFFEVKPEKGWSGDFLSCETLVQSESFKNGIVWIEEADGQNIRDWLSFLRKYEKASRNIELTERTLFCFCVVGLPPESVEIKQDVCLKFLPWKGYVDFFDMLLYAHWNFPVISEGGLRRELAVNMAACLALWDPEVIERLAESSFLNTLSPYSVLEEMGRERGWDVKGFEPCWENGAEEGRNGRLKLHSAYLALSDGLKELNSRIWSGQSTCLLPLIEEHRLSLIGSLKGNLRLPFPSCYESSITEAEDLEIGHIWFQIEKGDLHVTAQQKKRISKLRRLRNVLSHQQVAKPADIEFLIGCGRDFPNGGADKIPDPE